MFHLCAGFCPQILWFMSEPVLVLWCWFLQSSSSYLSNWSRRDAPLVWHRLHIDLILWLIPHLLPVHNQTVWTIPPCSLSENPDAVWKPVRCLKWIQMNGQKQFIHLFELNTSHTSLIQTQSSIPVFVRDCRLGRFDKCTLNLEFECLSIVISAALHTDRGVC